MSAIVRAILPRPLRVALRDAKHNLLYGSRKSFSVTIDGKTTHFLCQSTPARRWFYPRLQPGRHGNPDDDQNRGGLHEEPVTRLFLQHCRDAHCFFDVGANMGWFTCLAGTHMTQPRNVAFELDEHTHAILHANAHANNLCHHHEHQHEHGHDCQHDHDDNDRHDHGPPTGVVTVHAAVTDQPGQISYQRPRSRLGHPGFSIVAPAGSGKADEVRVPAVSIDDFCHTHGYSPDLMKIDVEGAEMQVLRGMTDTLDRCRPVLLMEVHPRQLAAQNLTPQQVLAPLFERGYAIHQVQGHRGSDHGEPQLTPITPESRIAENIFIRAKPDTAA